jgi:hypothetical protein
LEQGRGIRIHPDEAAAHGDVAHVIRGVSCKGGEQSAAVAINALNRAIDLADPYRSLTRRQRDRPRVEVNRSYNLVGGRINSI